MGVVETVHRRAQQRDPQDDPDLAHGLLYLCEGRPNVALILASVVGLSPPQFEALLAAARDGDLARSLPGGAETRAAEDNDEPMAPEFAELTASMLPKPWHRAVVRMLVRPRGVRRQEVGEALLRLDHHAPVPEAMRRVSQRLRRAGIEVQEERRGLGGSHTYTLPREDRRRVAALIASEWKDPA